MHDRDVEIRRAVETVKLNVDIIAGLVGVAAASGQMTLHDEVELLRQAGGDPLESIRLLAATYSDYSALRYASLDTVAALFRRIHAFAVLMQNG